MNGIYAMNVPQLEAALLKAQHLKAAATVERLELELRRRCSTFCCGDKLVAA